MLRRRVRHQLRLQTTLQWGFVATMIALGLLYQTGGYYYLVVHPEGAWDLRLRWLEQQAVFARRNPFDLVSDYYTGRSVPASLRPYVPQMVVGYPPWSYFSGIFLFWPPWPAARWLYGALNLVATAGLVRWTHIVARPAGPWASVLLGAAVWAVSAHYNTLVAGNYGILVVGLLLVAMWAHRTRHPWTSGMLAGVAMLKPTIAAPFLLPFVFRREGRVLAGCAGYLAVSSGVTWWFTGTDPLTMTVQMMRWGQVYVREAYGPLNFLLAGGVDREVAILLTAGVFLGFASVALWVRREDGLLCQFAIAALAGRLWTYHKVLDDVMLVFVLVAVGDRWLVRSQRGARLMFVLLGLSLWTPGRLVAYPDAFAPTMWFQAFHIAVWIGAGVFLALRGGTSNLGASSEGSERSAGLPPAACVQPSSSGDRARP